MDNTKTKLKDKYYTVYNMKFAIELKKMGHFVAMEMPNPKKPEFICWVFEVDETFHADLDALKGGSRNGRE